MAAVAMSSQSLTPQRPSTNLSTQEGDRFGRLACVAAADRSSASRRVGGCGSIEKHVNQTNEESENERTTLTASRANSSMEKS